MDLQDLQELLDFDDLQWSPPTSPLLQNNDEGQDRQTHSSGDEVEPTSQVGRVEYFRDDPMTPIHGMFSKGGCGTCCIRR